MAKQSQNDAHSGLFGAVFDNADAECIAIVGTIVFKMATKKSSGWRVRMAATLQCGSSERSMNDLLFRKKDGTC